MADKLKISKEQFDKFYEIEDTKLFGTDTDDVPKEEIKEKKEDSILSESEQAQDDKLEETLGWDTEEV